MKNSHMFLLFLAVRLASVWLVRTWYVPDEYWQSLEVAHQKAFGYGYLTWEWVLGLRSYVYPALLTCLYKVLELFSLDSVCALTLVPRIFQAILSAFADYQFFKWTGYRKWAAFNLATSWFWFYTGSRTLINNLETSFTTIALSLFPWKKEEQHNNSFIWVVALNCVIRPTAVIPWLPLGLYHILIQKEKKIKFVLKTYILKGFFALALCILIDSLFHGQFVVTSWEFLKLNVFHNVGAWYGSQPWHWYLSSGLPAILGIHILPFMLAVVKTLKDREVNVACSPISFTSGFIESKICLMLPCRCYSLLIREVLKWKHTWGSIDHL